MRARLAIGVVLLAACSHLPETVTVKIDVSPAQPAELAVSPLSGTAKRASPERCATPCSLEVPTEGAQELTLRASGYYPATVVLPGDSAWFHSNLYPDKAIVVPLIEREEAAPRATAPP